MLCSEFTDFSLVPLTQYAGTAGESAGTCIGFSARVGHAVPSRPISQIFSKKNALTCMHLPTALHAALRMGWIDPVCQVQLVGLEDSIGIGDKLAVPQYGLRKEAYDRHQRELKCLLHLQRSGVLDTGVAPSVQKTDLFQCDGYAFSRVQARLLLTVDCVVRRLLRDKYSLPPSRRARDYTENDPARDHARTNHH